MKLFNENNFSKIVIAVLLVINIIALFIIWSQSSKKPVPPPPLKNNSVRAVGLMKDQLNLTQEQTKEFRNLRREHFAKVNIISDSILALKRQIIDQIFSEKPDTSMVNKLAKQIGVYQSEIEESIFNHFEKFSMILNKGQKEKLHMVLTHLPGMPNPGNMPPPPPKR